MSPLHRTVSVNGKELGYEFEYKKVKNINLRIKPDGTVHVSANRLCPRAAVDSFVRSNFDAIQKTREKYRKAAEAVADVPALTPEQMRRICRERVEVMAEKYYPLFKKYCGPMPEIKYRKMKSRWGSCRPKENILTFNTALAYVPEKCAEYVVVHEFCHFVRADHSKAFYDAVASVLPDWKARRTEIRKYEVLL